jgi:exodeoxyribonuclease VII small subunit
MSKQKSFEEEMTRLEEIVKKLEENELPLEESISLFEEGAGLVKSAQEKLSRSDAKVQKILKALEQGPLLEDFRPEE